MRSPAEEASKERRKSLFALAGVMTLAAVVALAAARAQTPTTQSSAVPQWQTDAGGKMVFDVASVKQNKSGNLGYRTNFPLTLGPNMADVGSLMSASNLPLRNLFGFAYKISVGQTHILVTGLPNWVDSDRFDIQARATGNPTKDQFRLMVQTLLEDRFKLAMHHETRQLPIFALVLSKQGKTGPQLTPHADDAMCVEDGQPAPELPATAGLSPLPCGSIIFPGLRPSIPGGIKGGGRNLTIDYIAAFLTGLQGLNRPVVNRTGLSGTFDFWMELTPQLNGPPPSSDQTEPTGPTLLEALREQLGLKLESQKGAVDVLVIDHVEEPSPN